MEWVATLKAEVTNVAVPELSVPVPSEVVPSKNSTLPVGVPAPEPVTLTVAVKVTDWPQTEGLTDEVTAVDVLALFTTCERTVEVLP